MTPTPEREALLIAEAALADIGDADREPGDDLAWCERRAADVLPKVRAALAQAPKPQVAGGRADASALIAECRDALAEELAGWDIDPPLHHVKRAHDRCVAWLSAAPAQAAPADEGHEFTDWARNALLWVLWHHQGGSSPVGQPIRFALGMDQHERLSADQLERAKRWGERNNAAPGSCREHAAPAPQPKAAVVNQSLTTEQPEAAEPVQPQPLTDEQIETGFRSYDWSSVPHPFRGSVGFERGVKFAERHHGNALYATPPAAHAVDPGMVDRLQVAIEGECDGLAVDESHARAILEYVLAPKEQQP